MEPQIKTAFSDVCKNAWEDQESPFMSQKYFFFCLQGSWYSKQPAGAYGFNTKIGFKNYVLSPKI